MNDLQICKMTNPLFAHNAHKTSNVQNICKCTKHQQIGKKLENRQKIGKFATSYT
jgi:hypothetical protein